MAILLDDLVNDFSKLEDLKNFPKYSHIDKWFIKRQKFFQNILEASPINLNESDKEVVNVWQEMQAFYIGLKIQKIERTLFLKFVEPYKSNLIYSIRNFDQNIPSDFRYISDESYIRIIIDTMSELQRIYNPSSHPTKNIHPISLHHEHIPISENLSKHMPPEHPLAAITGNYSINDLKNEPITGKNLKIYLRL